MAKKQAFGWSLRWHYIDIDGSERESLLGKYFWIDGSPEPVPPYMNGYTTIVYKTRREARDDLRTLRQKQDSEWFRKNYGWLAVVKVRIMVEEIG